jgi:DNA polymerase III subunit delta'
VSLADVRFQDAAVRLLRTAVAGDHVSHAYLFAGPRGVGKGLVARQFVRLLLCSKPAGKGDSLDACGRCDNCRRMDRGVHPDLYWFQKEADRNDFHISQVVRGRGKASDAVTTTVTESVVLHPMQAERTVTVLDDAERLNREAANALLKTLEEPAPHAVLILLCADPSQLPGTILSRCQWVRFGPLPEEFVAEKLADALRTQAMQDPGRGRKAAPPRAISPQERSFICRFAGGSIEQAVRLAGTGFWDLKRQILKDVPQMDEAVALDIAESIAAWGRAQAKEQHAKAESPEANAIRRASARLALAAIASAFRDAVLLSVGTPETVTLTNSDQPETLKSLAAWGTEACTRAVSILSDTQALISRYVHTELAVENALIQASRLRPGAPAH